MDRDAQQQQQQQPQPVLIEAYEDEIDRRSEKSREGSRERRGDGQSSCSRQQQHQAQQSRIASHPAKPAADAEEKPRSHAEARGGDGSTSGSTKDGGLSPPAPATKRRRENEATERRRVLSKGVRGRGDTGLVRRRIENRDVVDHTYHDFSQIPPPAGDYSAGPSLKAATAPQDGGGLHTESEKSFPLLLHKVLSMEEYAAYVSWRSHGRAFRILNAKRFESVVCTEFFGHSRYGTFIRNLANWGFKYITQGHDRSCYYHEAFLYGLPHLTKYMSIEKNRRKVAPDPKNEPDFYLMNKTSPLPRLPDGKCSVAMAAAPQERDKSLDGVCSSLLSGDIDRPSSSPFNGVTARVAGVARVDKQGQEGASEDLILARMSKHHARSRGEASRTPASMFAAAALTMDPDGFLLTGRNQVRGHEFIDEPRVFDGKSLPMNNFRFSAATTYSNQSQQLELSESSPSFPGMHPLQGSLGYRDPHPHRGIFASRAAASSVMDQLESTMDSGILGGVSSRLVQQQGAPPSVGRYGAEDLFSQRHPPQHSRDNGSDFFRQHLSQHFASYSKQA